MTLLCSTLCEQLARWMLATHDSKNKGTLISIFNYSTLEILIKNSEFRYSFDYCTESYHHLHVVKQAS